MWSMLAIVYVCSFFLNFDLAVASLCLLVLVMSKYLMTSYSHFMFFHSYFVAVDSISAFLSILTVWMTFLMVLSMVKADEWDLLLFKFYVLNFILLCVFYVKKYVLFFMFFELSLIPTLMIILGWGAQPERMKAGSYLIMYTMVGSVPLLLCMIHQYYTSGTSSVFFIPMGTPLYDDHEFGWLAILWMGAFVMKLPIYGVHLWLPKAHVEAPVAGSMMLAGVLLKLGAYGMIRISSFVNLFSSYWSSFAFFWFLMSTCVVGLMCFRQADLKSLVAYSSVAHMSLVMAAFFSLDEIGMNGIMGMLVSHGMCSSGLFFGVQCMYEISGSRKMLLNRGLINISPLFCMLWFLLCAAKASAPPSLKLLSEFFLISSMMSHSNVAGLFCFVSVFLTGLFSMYLYTMTCHGKWCKLKKYWKNLTFRHYMVLVLHVIPLYGLTFLSNYMFV